MVSKRVRYQTVLVLCRCDSATLHWWLAVCRGWSGAIGLGLLLIGLDDRGWLLVIVVCWESFAVDVV